jgi:DNA repair protein RecO (recombination protein O)
LQPFRPLLLSWQSRSDLGTLIGAESEHAAPEIGGLALYAAYYLNELLLRLLARHDPHPELYRDYVTALHRLEENAPVEAVLREFEKQLLAALGYALVLDHDVLTGEALDPETRYDYRLEQGPTRAAADAVGGFVFSGASLLAIAAGRFDETAVLRDAKRLMRAALGLYLGDKPLKTRELLRQVMG